jgi:hypothetical protein
VIAKNVHEQVFVMREFALLVLLLVQLVQVQVLPLVLVLVLLIVQRVQPVRVFVQPVQVFAQLVQELLVLPQPLVLVVFHHEALLQLVHLLKKLKKLNPKNLGYMF